MQTAAIASASAFQALDALKQSLARIEEEQKNSVLWFAEILHRRLFHELGYSSIWLFATEALEFSQSRAAQYVRLAKVVQRFPALKKAVASGELEWTKAREVGRVATTENEQQWVERAKTCSRRELQAQAKEAKQRAALAREAKQRTIQAKDAQQRTDQAGAAGTEATQSPTETAPVAQLPIDQVTVGNLAPPPGDPPVRVSFELEPHQLARYDRLMERIRQHGIRSEPADVLLEALDALTETSTPRLACQAPAASTDLTKEDSTDGTRVPSDAPTIPHRTIAPYQVVIHKCEDCKRLSTPTVRGTKQLDAAAAAAVCCDNTVVGPDGVNRSAIPPRIRRLVLARDGNQCSTPACTHTRFLQVHHLTQRVEAGPNDPANLITLCSACHKIHHEQEEKLRHPP